MRRSLLGIIGLALLFGGGFCWVRGDPDYVVATAIMTRTGVLLAVIWLALPQVQQLLKRFPPWAIATVAGSLLVLAARPKLYVAVLPLLLAMGALHFFGWLLKPPPGTKREH